MDVKICVGTSCHRRGAEKVVKQFQTMIEEQNLSEKINLKGSFCLGRCTEDKVTILVGEKDYYFTSFYDAEDFFTNEILPKIK